jgi:hypothetical protein
MDSIPAGSTCCKILSEFWTGFFRNHLLCTINVRARNACDSVEILNGVLDACVFAANNDLRRGQPENFMRRPCGRAGLLSPDA